MSRMLPRNPAPRQPASPQPLALTSRNPRRYPRAVTARTARLTRPVGTHPAGAVVADDFGPPEGSVPGAVRVSRKRFDAWVADGTLSASEKMVPARGETMVPGEVESADGSTVRRRGRRGAPVPDLPVDEMPEVATALEGEG